MNFRLQLLFIFLLSSCNYIIANNPCKLRGLVFTEYCSKFNACFKKDEFPKLFAYTNFYHSTHNDTRKSHENESLRVKILNSGLFSIYRYHKYLATGKCAPGTSFYAEKCIPTQSVTNMITPERTMKKFNRVTCYYTNWSQYHIGFFPQDIPIDLCTIVLYAFFPITDDGEIGLSDHWADIGLNGIEKVVNLKGNGRITHILFSVGGWTYSGDNYGRWFTEHGKEMRNQKTFSQIWNEILATEESRAKFLNSISQMFTKYGFDGVELDYEYPACPQNDCKPEYTEQKTNFELLAEEFRIEFGKSKILSLATAVNPKVIEAGPNLARVSKFVNFLNIMTYDYYVYLPDSMSQHHIPIENVTNSIALYVNTLKVPINKINIGIPLYGRGYQLNPDDFKKAKETRQFNNWKSIGGSNSMEQTQTVGIATVNELCKLLYTCGYEENGESTNTTDPCLTKNTGCRTTYVQAHNNIDSWITYEPSTIISYPDVRYFKELRKIIDNYNISGLLFYAIDQDNFDGSCNLPGGSFPFMKAVLYTETYKNKNMLL